MQFHGFLIGATLSFRSLQPSANSRTEIYSITGVRSVPLTVCPCPCIMRLSHVYMSHDLPPEETADTLKKCKIWLIVLKRFPDTATSIGVGTKPTPFYRCLQISLPPSVPQFLFSHTIYLSLTPSSLSLHPFLLPPSLQLDLFDVLNQKPANDYLVVADNPYKELLGSWVALQPVQLN